jgi:hypothetical protein
LETKANVALLARIPLRIFWVRALSKGWRSLGANQLRQAGAFKTVDERADELVVGGAL